MSDIVFAIVLLVLAAVVGFTAGYTTRPGDSNALAKAQIKALIVYIALVWVLATVTR
jgi:hypothetical protein